MNKKRPAKSDADTLSHRLLAKMSDAGLSSNKAARAIGVTATSFGRWMKLLDAGGLPDATWNKIATSLRDHFRLDVTEVRPIVSLATTEIDVTLVPVLDVFKTREHLEALVAILAARQQARELLLVLARDRLARS